MRLFEKSAKSLRNGATKQTSTTDGNESLFATDGDPLTYSKTAVSVGNSYSHVSTEYDQIGLFLVR